MAERNIVAEIKAERGFDTLPSFYCVLEPHPRLLAQFWDGLRVAMAPGQIDAKTKEMIALGISIALGARYAIDSHLAIARRLGMSDAEYEEILLISVAFAQTAAICAAFDPKYDPAEYRQNGPR